MHIMARTKLSVLYHTYTIIWIFIILAHWNNNPLVYISLHSWHIILITSKPVIVLPTEVLSRFHEFYSHLFGLTKIMQQYVYFKSVGLGAWYTTHFLLKYMVICVFENTVEYVCVEHSLFEYYECLEVAGQSRSIFLLFYIISTLLIRTFLSRTHWLCQTLFIALKSENYFNLPFFSRTSSLHVFSLHFRLQIEFLVLCKVITSFSLNPCHWCKSSVFITIFDSTV